MRGSERGWRGVVPSQCFPEVRAQIESFPPLHPRRLRHSPIEGILLTNGERAIDFGGCRCQAFHLTRNAAATDPACSLSPDHRLVEAARTEAARPARELVTFSFRTPRTSRENSR